MLVQQVELYKDMVQITVKEATEEQITTLKDKINEKYKMMLVTVITIYFAIKNFSRLCPLAIAILIVESVYSLEKKTTENIRTISQKNTV